MIGDNNRVGPLALRRDRCENTSDRDDCGLYENHWTLHCPKCGGELDMVDHDDF